MIIKNWSDLGLAAKIVFFAILIICVIFIICSISFLPCEHSYEEWSVEKTSTCTTYGSQISVCTECGEKGMKRIEKIGHSYSDWIIDKEATCTEDGKRHKECSECKELLTEESILGFKGHELFVLQLENGGIVGSTVTYNCERCDFMEVKTVEDISISVECVSKEKEFINGCAYYRENYIANAQGGFGIYKYSFELYDNDEEEYVEKYKQSFSEKNTFSYSNNSFDKSSKNYSIVVTVLDAAGNEQIYTYPIK